MRALCHQGSQPKVTTPEWIHYFHHGWTDPAKLEKYVMSHHDELLKIKGELAAWGIVLCLLIPQDRIWGVRLQGVRYCGVYGEATWVEREAASWSTTNSVIKINQGTLTA